MVTTTINRESKLWQAIVWVLRVSVAIQCVGNAAATLKFGSKVHSLLASPIDVNGLGWSEPTAIWVDTVAGWSLFVAAVLVLVRPCWPVLLPIALWEFALAYANTRLGGAFGSEVTIPAHMSRIVAPLSLILIDPWPRKDSLTMSRIEVNFWMLRLAAASMFIAHGYEAYLLHPKFVDLLIGSSRHLLDMRLSQDLAEKLLYFIGLIDFALAALLIAFRWRWVAFYMAFWGLITAFSRMTAVGMGGASVAYPQTLIRAAHAGVPLAVGLYWWLAIRSQSNSPTDPPPNVPPTTASDQGDLKNEMSLKNDQ